MFNRLTLLAALTTVAVGLQILATAADQDLVIRRVWSEDRYIEPWSNGRNGLVSPDGRWLAYIDDQSRLIRYRFSDGRSFVVTAPAGATISNLAWSPGSNQVAYFQASNESLEVRVASVAGGSPRVITTKPRSAGNEYVPLGWSADANSLVVAIRNMQRILAGKAVPSNDYEFATVSLGTGEARVFKTIPSERNPHPLTPLLTADRASVTVDLAEGANRQIVAIDIHTGRETTLNGMRILPDDVPLLWTSEGNRLLFVSHRGGSPAVWSIEFRNGKAGLPVRVWRFPGVHRPGMPISGSISRELTLYVAVDRNTVTDVYTAEWDPQSGRVTGQLMPAAERYATFNSAPDWSPTGDRLLLQVGGPDNPDGIDLLVRSLATGEERVVRAPMAQFSRPRFSADGRSVVVQGVALKPVAGGPFKIDLDTGTPTRLDVVCQPACPAGFNPAWSRDGGRLFFEVRPRVLMQDQRTGTTSELYTAIDTRDRSFTSAPAPDGERVAVVDGQSLVVVDVASRQARKILDLRAPERFQFPGSLAWTPDGQWLLFGTVNGSRGALWRISAQGGEPQFTGLDAPGKFIYFVRVHPDGRQLAFAIGDAPLPRREIWAIQNFAR